MSESLENIELNKAQIEYIKHVTTLSTGSLVLMATLLEKLFANPLWKPALIASFIGFMFSILFSVIAYTTFFWDVEVIKKGPVDEGFHFIVGGVTTILMLLGFLVGVICLGAFSIRNLV